MIKDVNVVAGRECAPQHKLVVCNLIIKSVKDVKGLKILKFKEYATREIQYRC